MYNNSVDYGTAADGGNILYVDLKLVRRKTLEWRDKPTGLRPSRVQLAALW